VWPNTSEASSMAEILKREGGNSPERIIGHLRVRCREVWFCYAHWLLLCVKACAAEVGGGSRPALPQGCPCCHQRQVRPPLAYLTLLLGKRSTTTYREGFP
jgi:hypothetical protein